MSRKTPALGALLLITLYAHSTFAIRTPSDPLEHAPQTTTNIVGHTLLDAAYATEQAGSHARAAALYSMAATHFPELQDILLLRAGQNHTQSKLDRDTLQRTLQHTLPQNTLATPIPHFADIQLELLLLSTPKTLPPQALLKEAIQSSRENTCNTLLQHFPAIKLKKLKSQKLADTQHLVDTLHAHCEEHLEEQSTPDTLRLTISDSARVQRAHLLISHVHFNATLNEIARINTGKISRDELCDITFLKARATYRIRKTRNDAQAIYNKVATQCTKPSQSTLRKRSLYAMGKRLFDRSKFKESKTHFTTLLEDYPDASHADDAILYLARIARELKDTKTEQKLITLAQEKHQDGDMFHELLWEHLEHLVYQNKHKDYLKKLDTIRRPKHDEQYYSQGRLLYFKARALSKLGKSTEAHELWTSIWQQYPFSFYGYLALLEAKKARVPESKLTLLKPTLPPKNLSDDPQTTSLWPISPSWLDSPQGILARHQLFDFAARKQTAYKHTATSYSEQDMWTEAWLYHQAKQFHISHNIVRRQIPHRPWVISHSPEAQLLAWTIAWPMPFGKEVIDAVQKEKEQHDPSTQLHPALPMAIMREESSFIEDIVSYAGALGLMQLMLATARDHDTDLDSRPVSREDLLTAPINIRVGADHLYTLAKRMNNHPVLMAASYNAGAGAVRSWLKSPESREIALWTENIPYFQARNYSKRVIGSYIAYQWFLESAIDTTPLQDANKP